MNWSSLISNKRLGQELRHTERHDDRSEFKRDYDRLIFSAPFRRLQNKTQVFPLPGSIFVHNRLTHSLEVASVGMSLGNDVETALSIQNSEFLIQNSKFSIPNSKFQIQNSKFSIPNSLGTIVATACLAHDMGNPPFGHSGEKAIQAFFTEGQGSVLREKLSPETWSDITHFEGNANAFRLLTHRFNGRREGGFVMTYSTLASIVKYPYPSTEATKEHSKFGFFHTEKDTYYKIASELGLLNSKFKIQNSHPSPGEANSQNSKFKIQDSQFLRHPLVYLVEAADDICYEIMDIEDAHKLGLLTDEHTKELLLGFFDEDTRSSILRRIDTENILDINEQVVYLRASVIGKLENECVRAFLNNEEAIMQGTFQGSLIDHISPLQREAYQRCVKTAVAHIYHSKPVLDIELGGYRIIETLLTQLVDAVVNPHRFYSKQLLQRVSSQYEIQAPDLDSRIMAVLDFISGMTDVFALDFYQKINGTALPIV